jgi:hypothetical protein
MFDAKALLASSSTLLQVPLFLAAAVPGPGAARAAVPLAARYAPQHAAGFLQATSLPFIVAAVQIGQRLGVRPPTLQPEPPRSC